MRCVSPIAGLGVALGALSCSSGGSGGVHGPVFNVDAGSDVATDHPPDGSIVFDAPPDHKVRDAVADVPARLDAKHEGAAPKDSGGDAPTSDGGLEGSTADVMAPVDASICPDGMGTLALLGGSSTLAFGATSTNGASWKVNTFAGQSMMASPGLVPLGGGFLGVFPASNTVIMSTLFSSAAWSTPVAIPALAGVDAAATETGAPALAAIGANAEIVYAGSNFKFYHGVYGGGAWGAASDPVGGTISQDYGPSTPSTAVSGSTLYVAYDGGNNGLYVDSWTSSGGWAGAQPITGAKVGSVPPTLIALNGATADLMLVFEYFTTNLLYSVVHTPGSGWSMPVAVDPTANAASAVSLAPLANGGVVMVYEGSTNGYPYSSLYSPTATTPWTTPTAVYANSLPLQSPPSVAAGTCGVDAVAALVETVGVDIVTLKAGTWAPPVLVNGTAQLTYATLATLP